MTAPFADAVRVMSDTLRSHSGVSIIYRRGGLTQSLTATRGRTTFQVSDDTGGFETVMSWDFLIEPAQLGSLDPPQRGDEIVIVEGLTGSVYQVLPFGGEPLYAWCDANKTLMRVHAKYVGPNI